MTQRDLFRPTPRPWNRGRIIGPKPPFKAKHVWAIRQQLKVGGRVRDLALFDCGIDAKLRGLRPRQASSERRRAGRRSACRLRADGAPRTDLMVPAIPI